MMKNLKVMLALSLSLLALSACGGSDSNNTATTTANTCGVGSVNTSYGCVPQGSCPMGQGLYNGTCITASVAPNTTYPTTYPNGTVCAAGQVNTQYGCLAQGGCAMNSAMYNGSCVPAINTNNFANNCAVGQVNTQYGCVAQANCAAGQGLYNGVCISATVSTNYDYNYQSQYTNNGGVCPMGTVNTVAGCLSQGPCGYNQVFYNNECYDLVQRRRARGGIGFQFRLGWGRY